MTPSQDLLLSAFRIALDAANTLNLLPPCLPKPPNGKTLVVGGGKAAAAMARAVEEHWPAQAILSGCVVTRYQHGLPLKRIDLVEASHPLPDGRGAEAAQRMLDEIAWLTRDDLLLVLLSGGGSSLLALPVEGVTLRELRSLTKALLESGAAIQEINTVRKHLTRFSGGRVAAQSAAPVQALILSDVVGDDPTHIASGPCAPDPTSFADALAIIAQYSINAPLSVTNHLQLGISGGIADTPKPGAACFAQTRNHVIGNAKSALAAAERWLSALGVRVLNLGEIEAEARQLGTEHALLLRNKLALTPRPFALLSGGETTVKMEDPAGRGGRNTEYLLSLGLALEGVENVYALACDSDGIDGTEDNAGAVWTPDTLKRARTAGMDAAAFLTRHDAYSLFHLLGDLVTTGPTRTNINDFRLVLAA